MDVMLGIYCRTSRKESISGIDTIEQQRNSGLKFAETNHLNYNIYEDSGKSGYKEKSQEDPFSERIAFKQLLADIKSGKINEIWVWELSRLARKNKYYVQIIEFLAENKIVLWVQNQKIDLSDPTQKALVGMQGVFAELERQEIIGRTSRGKSAATDRGKLRHGSLYGYHTDPKTKITSPVKEELEIVKSIFEDYLNGLNLREIGKKYFVGENAETAKLLSVVKKVKQILAHEEYTGQNLKTSGRQIEKDFEEEKISELSELSVANNCIPPIRRIGSNVIAKITIPIPPIHCNIARHSKNPFGASSICAKMVAPVVVNPEILSKIASVKDNPIGEK